MQHYKKTYIKDCQYLNMVHLNEDYQYFNKINPSYTGIRVVNRKDCEILKVVSNVTANVNTINFTWRICTTVFPNDGCTGLKHVRIKQGCSYAHLCIYRQFSFVIVASKVCGDHDSVCGNLL
jgi:hypothetical protein